MTALEARIAVLDAKVDACIKLSSNLPLFILGATDSRKGHKYWKEAANEMIKVGEALKEDITKIENEYSNNTAGKPD